MKAQQRRRRNEERQMLENWILENARLWCETHDPDEAKAARPRLRKYFSRYGYRPEFLRALADALTPYQPTTEELVAAADPDTSTSDLAKELRMSARQVRRIRREYGEKPRKPGRPRRQN